MENFIFFRQALMTKDELILYFIFIAAFLFAILIAFVAEKIDNFKHNLKIKKEDNGLTHY